MGNRFFIMILGFVVALMLTASPSVLAKVDPDTLVGMWLFEERARGMSLRILLSPETTERLWVPRNGVTEKFGQALEFDGSGVYVQVDFQ